MILSKPSAAFKMLARISSLESTVTRTRGVVRCPKCQQGRYHSSMVVLWECPPGRTASHRNTRL